MTALPGTAGARRVLLTVRDVTAHLRAQEERRRADGQVRHAQKLESLAILAGGVAHDFNNILMTILGRAGIGASRLASDDPARLHLRDMEQAARRAAQLCQQLLAYAGKGRTRSTAVDARAVVDELARVLSISAPHVRFVREFAADAPAVIADENQLRQVVMNLITNAAEAMAGREGTIVLRVAPRRLSASEPIEPDGTLPPGDYVAIEVADQGSGMDEDTRRRMFEPFFTTKPDGRGLGMAAALGIVRGHHGGLQVQSVRGRGTTVRVLLPRLHGPAAELTPSRVPIVMVPPGTVVLVVDDEASVRGTTRDMLRHLGCEVLEAASGDEALTLLARERGRIRAVVLDLTMPGLDGAETFHRLRGIDPLIQVVLASGYSRDEVVRSLGTADIAGFLQKPYDVDALAAALHAALHPADRPA
jgi:signal transduction histidine kinase/CheY-like chemotaxis protein